MKYGIYCSFWEKEWGGEIQPYIEKCKHLGFDIVEVPCGDFYKEDTAFFDDLRSCADDYGMIITGGYGPRHEHNLAGTDEGQINKTFAFYKDMFRKMELAGIDRLGGALYSYWPVDFGKALDKEGDTARSIARMRQLADMADSFGVTLCMESLNRFEGYMINQAYECVNYVKAVDKANVKVMLDTFHMNIEEDSIVDAIIQSQGLLGHVHVGNANRRCPGPNERINWKKIGGTLREIKYDGYIVMEPFVRMGGKVGQDVHLWRDLSDDASDEDMDRMATDSLLYLREQLG